MKIEFHGVISGSDAVKNAVEFYCDDDDGSETWFYSTPEQCREWATHAGKRIKITLELDDEQERDAIGFKS